MNGADFGDPYLAWSRRTEFRGHAALRNADARIPLLIEADATQRAALQALPLVVAPAWSDATHFFTALARREQLADIEGTVKAMELALPLVATGKAASVAAPKPSEPLSGPVMAVIDHGCAFLNAAFRQASAPAATRLLALWDQGEAAMQAPWQTPREFGYGRELPHEAINSLLRQLTGPEPHSEATLYASLQYLLDERELLRDTAHGTHVLDTAAGAVGASAPVSSAKPAADDTASRAPLIFVDTPRPVDGDTTNAANGAFLLDALRYIRLHAGPDVPVVVNISLGAFAGPHDGSSLVERAIDDFIERDKLMVVTIAGGNAALERWHASGVVTQDGQFLRWRTMPEDCTDSFVEVWFDAPASEAPAKVTIEVTPPGGAPAVSLTELPGECDIVSLAGGHLGTVFSRPASDRRNGSGMFLIAVGPSAGERRMATAGIWRIGLRCDQSGVQVPFDAWIQRDEPAWSTRAPALQSHFESASFGITVGGAAGGLSNLASGDHTVVVGAACLEDGRISRYSSRGGQARREDKHARDIDVVAAADEGYGIIGLPAAGVRSHTLTRMGGTSVAAPAAAREICNHLAGHARTVTRGRHDLVRQERERLHALPSRTRAPRGDPQAESVPLLRPDRRAPKRPT